MIKKELFITILEMIKHQNEINCNVENALKLVGVGDYKYGAENDYLSALLLLLNEIFHDTNDYLGTWIYDPEPLVLNGKTIDTVGELYDLLVANYK